MSWQRWRECVQLFAVSSLCPQFAFLGHVVCPVAAFSAYGANGVGVRCCALCIEPGQHSLLCWNCSLLARFVEPGVGIDTSGCWHVVKSGLAQWSGWTRRTGGLPCGLRSVGHVSGNFWLCWQAPVWILAWPPFDCGDPGRAPHTSVGHDT